MSTPEDSTARIAEAMRDVIADAVLTNERIARSIGLNVVDLQTLGVIMRQGAPVSPGDVATLTALPTSTVTRVLDRLEAAGHIRRSPDANDRRRTVIETIPASLAGPNGEDPYAAIMDGMRRLHEGFSPAELEVVARYLEAMSSGTRNWDQ